MKKFIVIAILVLVLGFGAYKFTHHNPNDVEPAAGGPGQQGPMPVTVQTLVPQDVRTWTEFSGRVVAVDRVQIRARVGGAIEKVYFESGAVVEKGQPLFLIDPRPYKAALNQAAAAVATTRAQASLATTEAERAERLIKDNAISQRELAARINAARVAQANIQAAEAALQQARLNLDYATITAPVRGKISRAEITEGNLVDPSAGQVLAEIVSMDPIYVDFDVDEETYLKHIRAASVAGDDSGLPIELSLKADTQTSYQGKIVAFDNKLDAASGTIRARAIFENAEQTLVPGMYATVRLGSADKVTAVLISDRYVTTDQDKKIAFVVGADNIVQYRPVKLGGTIGNQRIVEEGLQPGEKIIVKGLQRIRPGMPVIPKEESDTLEEKPQAEQLGEAPPAQEESSAEQEMPAPPIEEQAEPQAEKAQQ